MFQGNISSIREAEPRQIEGVCGSMFALPPASTDVAAGIAAEIIDAVYLRSEIVPGQRLNGMTFEQIEPQRQIAAHLFGFETGPRQAGKRDCSPPVAARLIDALRHDLNAHTRFAQHGNAR